MEVNRKYSALTAERLPQVDPTPKFEASSFKYNKVMQI